MKLGKKTSGLPELSRLHAQRYDTTIEQSQEIIESVLDTIVEMMQRTDVLSLRGFGKFQTKYRAPYTMQSNLLDVEDRAMPVPESYKVKFQAAPKFNEAARQYFADKTNEKAPE